MTDAEKKAKNLREGLVLAYGTIQLIFMGWVGWIFLAAMIEEDGQPLHDGIIRLGRAVDVDRAAGNWIIVSLALAAGFAALYAAQVRRWNR